MRAGQTEVAHNRFMGTKNCLAVHPGAGMQAVAHDHVRALLDQRPMEPHEGQGVAGPVRVQKRQ